VKRPRRPRLARWRRAAARRPRGAVDAEMRRRGRRARTSREASAERVEDQDGLYQWPWLWCVGDSRSDGEATWDDGQCSLEREATGSAGSPRGAIPAGYIYMHGERDSLGVGATLGRLQSQSAALRCDCWSAVGCQLEVPAHEALLFAHWHSLAVRLLACCSRHVAWGVGGRGGCADRHTTHRRAMNGTRRSRIGI